jgi:phosphinothricin acetyltransferase
VYSTAITEVVPPAYRGAALALRSMPGYGAGAVAPLVFGAILDAHGTRTAGGWGWAFVSPGIAGAGAVVSVIALQTIPEAALLRREPTARTERSDLCAMTSRTFTIRLATLDDSAPIAAIYNEGIADRIATFETEPRSPEQIRAQLAHRGDRYPTVVVEHEGRVVAWAGAGAYRGRPAYAGVAEHSVYVARDARGTGAGRAALDALCRAYAERGFWKIVSRIFPENVASLALHRRCGFREVGTYRRHGKLEGEWRDCVIVEKLLDGTS